MSENGVPKINLLQFYRTDLLPIYRKMSGHEETYPEVAGDFDTFLIEHAYDRILFNPGLTNQVTARFEEFLQRGFFHPSSPAGRVMKIVNEMKNTADPFTAYLLWQDFVNQYVFWVRKLVLELEELRHKGVILSPSYIEGIIEQSEAEFSAKKMNAEVDAFFVHLPHILKLFIGSQKGAINSHRSGVLFLKYGDMDSLSGQIDPLAGYDDPFEWIKVVFTNLESLEKIYKKTDEGGQDVRVYTKLEDIPYKRMTNRDFGLSVKLEGKIPHEKPLDPDSIRRAIDILFFVCALSGTCKKPVELKVSWDGRKKLMIVSTSSLGNITKSKEWNHAEELIARANGLISMREGTIQFPFGRKKGGAKNRPDAEDASSGLASTNGASQAGAAPALQVPLIIAPANQMIMSAGMLVMPVNVVPVSTQMFV